MYSVLGRNGDWKEFYRTSPVTSVIIVLNTLMLLVSLVLGGFYGDVFQFGALYPPFIIEYNEWYRILTAAFMHGGFLHFFANVVIGLLTFSSGLERSIGSKKFSLIYFGSMIFAGLMIVFLGDYDVPTVGASGAIFGVMGSFAYIALFRKDMITQQDAKTIASLIAINIGFTVYSALSDGNISFWGHFGGLIGGFLLSFLVIRRNIFKVIS